MDVHTCALSQAVITEFLTSGLLFKKIEKAKPLYKAKKDAMIDGIDKYMPEAFRRTNPQGGLFIWGEFENLDVADLFPEVCKRKVAYVSGESFFADGAGRNTIRLNYSNATFEQIDRGMKILGNFFKERV